MCIHVSVYTITCTHHLLACGTFPAGETEDYGPDYVNVDGLDEEGEEEEEEEVEGEEEGEGEGEGEEEEEEEEGGKVCL